MKYRQKFRLTRRRRRRRRRGEKVSLHLLLELDTLKRVKHSTLS